MVGINHLELESNVGTCVICAVLKGLSKRPRDKCGQGSEVSVTYILVVGVLSLWAQKSAKRDINSLWILEYLQPVFMKIRNT